MVIMKKIEGCYQIVFMMICRPLYIMIENLMVTGDHKNSVIEKSSGDYIFHIDAMNIHMKYY